MPQYYSLGTSCHLLPVLIFCFSLFSFPNVPGQARVGVSLCCCKFQVSAESVSSSLLLWGMNPHSLFDFSEGPLDYWKREGLDEAEEVHHSLHSSVDLRRELYFLRDVA